jgi:hypothetical protein
MCPRAENVTAAQRVISGSLCVFGKIGEMIFPHKSETDKIRSIWSSVKMHRDPKTPRRGISYGEYLQNLSFLDRWND